MNKGETMTSLLSINNLSLNINGQSILKDVSFNINEGQHTSLNGPSGSGKSTILKIIARLMEANQGSIKYLDNKIEDIEYTKYRQEVSYVIQNPLLFDETVYDNLSYPAKIRNQNFDENRAKELMNELLLDHISLDKNIDSLSGGEKQRVGLIRNLMYPPRVLLLDEVTSSLDDTAAKAVWDLLFKEAQNHNITLVWISHDESEQNLAKKLVYLKNGELIKEVENA